MILLNIADRFFETLNQNIAPDLANVVPVNFLFFFTISIIALIIFLVVGVFIVPLFRRPGKRVYNRYLQLRDEMEQIDSDLANHKIIFSEYLARQFSNAQEYQKLIKILISNPEYKSKITSYALKDSVSKAKRENNIREIKRSLSKEEIINLQINKLSDVLYSKTKKFTKEDIYAILVFEGFNDFVIKGVLKDLINKGATFSTGKSTLSDRKQLSDFLGTLFEGKKDINSINKNTLENISLDNQKTGQLFEKDFESKKITFEKVSDVDSKSKKEEISKEKKGNFFSRLFGKKEKEKPTINEIDNILKKIEQDLKKKDI